MRLIDSDEFNKQEVLEKLRTAEFDDEIKDAVEKISTAYDVDKVIEQLEERKKYLLKNFVFADKAEEVKKRTMTRINEIDGLIEIVKSGGVADE